MREGERRAAVARRDLSGTPMSDVTKSGDTFEQMPGSTTCLFRETAFAMRHGRLRQGPRPEGSTAVADLWRHERLPRRSSPPARGTCSQQHRAVHASCARPRGSPARGFRRPVTRTIFPRRYLAGSRGCVRGDGRLLRQASRQVTRQVTRTEKRSRWEQL